MSERAVTYIEVVLKIDHDADLTDEQLHDACGDAAFGGQVLIEGERSWNTETRETTIKGDALVEEVHTVWVKGSAP